MDYKFDEHYKVEEDQLGTRIEHPSFGTIAFSRRAGGEGNALFGSSIYHHDTIHLAIRHADMTRGLNADWYMGRSEIIECEMSYSQFVEAITNMNVGTGIPCTLTYTEKDGHLPQCHYIDKYTEFTDEMSNMLSENNKDAKTIFETKKSIGKGDRELILSKIYSIVQGAQNSAEFSLKQFQTQMDKTVQEAKSEIEAFTQNKMFCIAQQALVENRDKISKQLQEKNLDFLEDHKTEE